MAKMLPADAGIGSNDTDALHRAQDADTREPDRPRERPETTSPAIKSPMTSRSSGSTPKGGFIDKFKNF